MLFLKAGDCWDIQVITGCIQESYDEEGGPLLWQEGRRIPGKKE